MSQLLSVGISFLLIPLLNRCKLKLSYTLLISSFVLGILSGTGVEAIFHSFVNVFIESSSRNTLLTVTMVSILGGLMKHYKILDKIVEIIFLLIRDKKKILMIIPAMIGVLIIPGGALLSAPFVNNIGEDMNIPPQRRAAINVVFRHMALFLLPYSTGLLIITATLPEVNVFKLILLNLIFVIPTTIIGYFLFIKDIKAERSTERKNIGKNLYKLVLLTSPIYICVIINAITGLPFYLTLFSSILIVYLQSSGKEFLKIFIKSINVNTVITIIAVLFMKEIILRMDKLFFIFENLFSNSNSMISILIMFLISSTFLGVITGNQSASLAIILPMISKLNLDMEATYLYAYYAFVCTFLGYFFSPIHLCQVFTLQVMNVSALEFYKEYRIYAPLTILVLFFSVIAIKLLLMV